MPTSHVRPESDELLQNIAEALWKARKVLVVTGAGISTNSGIPDFRSKNGLYSLIQAQFEAAASGQTSQDTQNDDHEDGDAFRPTKRRKLQDSGTGTPTDETPKDTIHCAPMSTTNDCCSSTVDSISLPSQQFLATPQRGSVPMSSSPLSSPPTILFDPSEECGAGTPTSTSSDSAGDQDSDATSDSASDADGDDGDVENDASRSRKRPPTLSKQSSFSSNGRSGGLPVMKGRELFDSSIWADPVKTAVFYTFATTLRQKMRDIVPTRSHEFISHLRDTGKLVRCYTQNIDEIEEKVGLTTSLFLGPGRKGRFSSRSTPRASLAASQTSSQESDTLGESSESSQSSVTQQAQNWPNASQELQGSCDSQTCTQTSTAPALQSLSRGSSIRGVECVFLHGSLRLLRCFHCGHTTPWDEEGRENETLFGRQPSCPRCEGATAAREGRGKRALAVGKLRPDIVLYGEEHPNAHLISPIVQHDISLVPDMLLILGTSLRVHGLKVLVREFSKAVHSRGGKVVYVNFTKPPESVWSEVIDYWVQWDCDAWVADLKERKPMLWLPPGSVVEEPKKKRLGVAEKEQRERDRQAKKLVRHEQRQQQKKDKVERKLREKDERRAARDRARQERRDEKHARQEAKKREKKDERGRKRDERRQAKAREKDTAGCAGLAVQFKGATDGAFFVWQPVSVASPSGIEATIAEASRKRKASSTNSRKPGARHSAPSGMEMAGNSENEAPAAPKTELEPQSATLVPCSENYSIVSAVKTNSRQRRPKKIFEGGSKTGPMVVPATQATLLAADPRASTSAPARVPLGPLAPRSLEQTLSGSTAADRDTKIAVAKEEGAWTDTDQLMRQLTMELMAAPLPAIPTPSLPSISQLFPHLARATTTVYCQDMCPAPQAQAQQEWSCSDQLQWEESKGLRGR